MQKQARKGKVYNIVLCVDESGSMAGDKAQMAAEVTTFLAKSFEGININLAIVGFNRFIMVHKEFDEPVKDYKVLYQIVHNNAHQSGCGQNNDFDALCKSYDLLVGRKGQNFVIFLSDGEPVASSNINSFLNNPGSYQHALKTGTLESKTDIDGKKHFFWFDERHKLRSGQRNEVEHFHHLVKSNESLADTIGIGIQTDSWQCPVNIREDSLDRLKPVILEQIRKKIKRG